MYPDTPLSAKGSAEKRFNISTKRLWLVVPSSGCSMPHAIEVKTILNKKKSRDSWFLDDYTLNLYSGCSFNCLFCYIRGSKYGEHMESRLSYKKNALELLDKQLSNRAKKGQYGYIVMSSATDPYLQFEEELKLTRGALELILKYRFPVHMITRSDLVLRDVDLLRAIDINAILPEELKDKPGRGAIVTFSFSTIEDEVARVFEPGATLPSVRLRTHEAILSEGFLSGISMMPLLPYISDTGESLHAMFSRFRSLGSKYVMPATITLFGEGPSDSKTLVFRAIEKHYPHLSEKYRKLFSGSTELPDYYNRAFGRKAGELSGTYNLPDRILKVKG